MNLKHFLDLIGFNHPPLDLREKLISIVGGFLGIMAIFLSSHWLLNPEVAVYIIPSMGASAVLLFAAPHAPFSQPWNVLAGHVCSAIIGVACWQWIPDYFVAASASVALAIGAMVYLRCIHPPGGATALAAVIGSEALHNLGYSFAYQLVLLNVLTILLVAVVFNALFKWRKYPAQLKQEKSSLKQVNSERDAISHADFIYALSHIDTYVDIDENDLLNIYNMATKRHEQVAH